MDPLCRLRLRGAQDRGRHRPQIPREISTWIPQGEGSPWYVHTVVVGRVEGQRIVVVGSEVFENRNVHDPAWIWVLDATDLSRPKLLSTWTNPGEHGSRNILFSTHDFRLVGSTLFLAHYHGGTWVLDLARPESPQIRGYSTEGRDSGWRPPAGSTCCFGLDLGGVPMIFDVVGNSTHVLSADRHGGLYVYEINPPLEPSRS